MKAIAEATLWTVFMRRLGSRFLCGDCRRNFRHGELGQAMQDLWMVLFTVIFFGLAFGYVHACQKLR
jgi:hypothetical protein